jgi:lipopolysaccharide heptosyltransferase II
VTFAAIDLLGTSAFAAARALRRWLTGRTTTSPNPQHDPKVILLVQLDHLGDAIISTAMLPALRARYPKASIEVLAGAWNREVFEVLPAVDRVHVSRVNRFARTGLARLAWIPATFWCGLILRRRKVDLGIDVRGEFPVTLILWLCGARRRLGWASGGGGFLLTDRAEFVPGRPEVESRAALLAALGIRPATADALRPSFHPSHAARRRIARELAELSAREPASGPRVVLHVGAGTPAKSWPVEHWQELLGRILVGHGAQVVLVGTRSDRIIADQILGGRTWPGVVDWTGRLGIVELAALLEQADLLVGADSGPAHLAAAVGTPAVVLFSGTNSAGQWQPCGQQVSVIRHEVDCSPCHRECCPRTGHPCMRLLHPRQVAAEVERVLCENLGDSRRRRPGRKRVRG